MVSDSRIKIIVVDDQRIVREGIVSLINRRHDMEVVAEAENGRTAVKLAGIFRPDVILMDISMPDLNGIEASKIILNKQKSTKIIILSIHTEAKMIRSSIKAGVYGYLLKTCSFQEILKAVKSVINGKPYFSNDISETISKDYYNMVSNAEDSHSEEDKLSERESEVLQLLVEGKLSKDIAVILDLSTRTIDVHRHNLMKKLQINNLANLTKYAIRKGITSI